METLDLLIEIERYVVSSGLKRTNSIGTLINQLAKEAEEEQE